MTLIPGRGTEVLHAIGSGQKFKKKKKDPRELRGTRTSATPEWQGHRSKIMVTFLQGSASGHLVQKRVADTEHDLDASHRQWPPTPLRRPNCFSNIFCNNNRLTFHA